MVLNQPLDLDKVRYLDVVRVVWEDSVHKSGWVQDHKDDPAIRVFSAGMFARATDRLVILAQGVSPDGVSLLSPLYIPRVAVISLEVFTQ